MLYYWFSDYFHQNTEIKGKRQTTQYFFKELKYVIIGLFWCFSAFYATKLSNAGIALYLLKHLNYVFLTRKVRQALNRAALHTSESLNGAATLSANKNRASIGSAAIFGHDVGLW